MKSLVWFHLSLNIHKSMAAGHLFVMYGNPKCSALLTSCLAGLWTFTCSMGPIISQPTGQVPGVFPDSFYQTIEATPLNQSPLTSQTTCTATRGNAGCPALAAYESLLLRPINSILQASVGCFLKLAENILGFLWPPVKPTCF